MRSHIRKANLLEQLTESTSDVRVTTGSDLSDAESAHNSYDFGVFGDGSEA